MAGLPGKTVALGSPQSSVHQISQVQLADWMTEIEGLTGLSGFAFVRGSFAALSGLGTDGDYALVVTTAAERGIYQRSSGSWSKVADLPLIMTESLAADQAEADRILAQAAAVSAGDDATSAAASATAAATSQSLADVARTQAQLAAVAAGATLYASVAAGEADTVDGDVFLVSTEPGVQVYENDTGTGSFLGWLGEVLLDDLAALTAWNPPAYPQTGLIVRTRKDGAVVTVAASGASDQNRTLASGVKLYVEPDIRGQYPLDAFGLPVSGVATGSRDDATMQAAITALSGKAVALGAGPYDLSTVPTGIDNVHLVGTPRTEFLGAKLPYFGGVLTMQETAIIAGCIRFYAADAIDVGSAAGWYFIRDFDDTHDPILLTSVTASGASSVVLDVQLNDLGLDPAKWTPAGFTCGPDEGLATRGVTFGASVGTTSITIQGSFNSNAPNLISYNGSAWTQTGNTIIYTFSFVSGATAYLECTRPSNAVKDNWNAQPAPVITPAWTNGQTAADLVYPSLMPQGLTGTSFRVNFRDKDGAELVTQNTNMKFWVHDPVARNPSFNFAADPGAGTNIWMIGAFVRRSGTY